MVRMKDSKLSDIVSQYNKNIKKLFRLGREELDFRINYKKRFKFNQDDVEQLLLLANDKKLYNYDFKNDDDIRYFFAIVFSSSVFSGEISA